jgi:hypothetical protein
LPLQCYTHSVSDDRMEARNQGQFRARSLLLNSLLSLPGKRGERVGVRVRLIRLTHWRLTRKDSASGVKSTTLSFQSIRGPLRASGISCRAIVAPTHGSNLLRETWTLRNHRLAALKN